MAIFVADEVHFISQEQDLLVECGLGLGVFHTVRPKRQLDFERGDLPFGGRSRARPVGHDH